MDFIHRVEILLPKTNPEVMACMRLTVNGVNHGGYIPADIDAAMAGKWVSIDMKRH
jgi:hypothetical protein